MTSPSAASAGEIRSRLEADFKHRVTLFYRSLQITPPYHSVEKAMLSLRDTLKNLPETELRAAAADPAPLDVLFAHVFIESGLAKKSRGIITKLLADRPDILPTECKPFEEAFKQ
ncbi:MAG: hypothetical protein AABY77_03390 [Nitrospirota bacterium]